MNNELVFMIEQVSRERGIDPEEIIHAIEDAILTASKKHYKNREDLTAHFNNQSGQVELYVQKLVVESVSDPEMEVSLEEARASHPQVAIGETVPGLLTTRSLGRIDAQAAKQIIFQRVKEAERKKVFDEYSSRVGELVNGIVKNSEKGDIIVDLGSVEAILPRSMQIPGEDY